jgi:hypothetical protein
MKHYCRLSFIICLVCILANTGDCWNAYTYNPEDLQIWRVIKHDKQFRTAEVRGRKLDDAVVKARQHFADKDAILHKLIDGDLTLEQAAVALTALPEPPNFWETVDRQSGRTRYERLLNHIVADALSVLQDGSARQKQQRLRLEAEMRQLILTKTRGK